MQAFGLVRISKKQNLVENSFTKLSECKKIGVGPRSLLYIYNLNLTFVGTSPVAEEPLLGIWEALTFLDCKKLKKKNLREPRVSRHNGGPILSPPLNPSIR